VTTSGRRAEDGYAMVAAVVAMAVLALMSLALIETGRGFVAGVAADAERARLAAAADAGLALAVRGLSKGDRGRRWTIDGRPRRLAFDGADLLITVEDERGKIPINLLADDQVRNLFQTLGASGETLAVRTDSLLDWIDDDDEVRDNGAEAPWYAARGRRPRNGPLRSMDELALVRGMSPEIVARLRSVATVYRDQRVGFDSRYAMPLALAVMEGTGLDSPAVIDRERELAGQRPAIDLADNESLVARPLTIRVAARRPGGGKLVRAFLIELTGQARRPYVVRRVD
jgi:general secretion pathway protein K